MMHASTVGYTYNPTHLSLLECDETQFYKANCSTSTVVKNKGDNARWQCTVLAPHGSSIGIVKDKTVYVDNLSIKEKSSLDDICTAKEPRVVYDVVEEMTHACYSKFTVLTVICSMAESVVGDYSVVWGEGNMTERSEVKVKLATAPATDSSLSGETSMYFGKQPNFIEDVQC